MHISSSILRQLRVSHHLTQSVVANYLQVDRSNYSKYELGKLEMNLDMVVDVAKLYNVTTDYVLGVDNSPYVPEQPDIKLVEKNLGKQG